MIRLVPLLRSVRPLAVRAVQPVAVVAGTLAFGAPTALAQGASDAATIYRLNPASNYEQGCFGPCMCPILVGTDVRGTFVLTSTGFDGLFNTYAVTDVNWIVASLRVSARCAAPHRRNLCSGRPASGSALRRARGRRCGLADCQGSGRLWHSGAWDRDLSRGGRIRRAAAAQSGLARGQGGPDALRQWPGGRRRRVPAYRYFSVGPRPPLLRYPARPARASPSGTGFGLGKIQRPVNGRSRDRPQLGACHAVG